MNLFLGLTAFASFGITLIFGTEDDDNVIKFHKDRLLNKTHSGGPFSHDGSAQPEIALPEAKPIPAPILSKAEEKPTVLLRAKRNWIVPGTNWCGAGNVAPDDEEVGDIPGPDRCCRQHDKCPHSINGMTRKYNLYNYLLHTISHCECDDIFRTCLKVDASDQANVIGEIFFNYLRMKCFVFQREQVCAERAWWGKCVRHTWQWSAQLRDPLSFPN